MRKFFISDIHGCYNEMMGLLELAKYDPNVDQLVVGGDMIDRGPDSAKVLQHIYQLQQNHESVIVLRGNHEDMMGDYFNQKGDIWLSFGQEAIESFQKELTDPLEFDRLIRYAVNLPVMAQDGDYIYVHAGINPTRSIQLEEELMWMPYDKHAKRRFDSYDPLEILEWSGGRKVIHGHTPKKYIFDTGASICCDLGAGTTETAKLALVDLSNDKYYYYDFVEKEYGERHIARKRAYVK